MSVRNFERVFTREVGTTPSQYVLHTRVEAARRQLERTETGLKQVASATGFGNVDVMRRAFVRLLGITPATIASSQTIRPANEWQGDLSRWCPSSQTELPGYAIFVPPCQDELQNHGEQSRKGKGSVGRARVPKV